MPGAEIFYICNICSYVVDSVNVLKHLTSHLDDSYCSVCALDVEDLSGHVEVHLKKLFRCPTCDEVYSSTRDYRAHRNSHRLNCFHCGESCEDEESLRLHVRNNHPEEIEEEEVEGERSVEEEEQQRQGSSSPEVEDEDYDQGLEESYEADDFEDDGGVDNYPEENSSEDFRQSVLLLTNQLVFNEAPDGQNDSDRKHEEAPVIVVKRKRGRPKGAKNKPRHSGGGEPGLLSQNKSKKTGENNADNCDANVESGDVDVPEDTEESTGMKTRAKSGRKAAKNPVRRVPAKKAKAKKNEVTVHTCETCGETFPNWKRLRHHMNTVGCHKCPFCGALFKQTTNMVLHIRVHTGERPHLCSLCGKKFRTTGGLNDHMLRHNNIKAHKCRHCPKSFVQLSHRNRHENLVHKNIKNHQCTICGKLFSLAFHARRHALIHTGQKQFECATCGKQVLDVSNFRKHLDVHKKRGDRVLAVSDQILGKGKRLSLGIEMQNTEITTETQIVVNEIAPENQMVEQVMVNEVVQENQIVEQVMVNEIVPENQIVVQTVEQTEEQIVEQTEEEGNKQLYPLLRLTLSNPGQANQLVATAEGQVEPEPDIENTNVIKVTSFGSENDGQLALHGVELKENITVILT